MSDATDKVISLIPLVIVTDLALRVADRTFPQRRQSKKKRRSSGINHSLRI